MSQTVDPKGAAGLELEMQWQSDQATHDERLYGNVGIWSDFLPGDLAAQLAGKAAGDHVICPAGCGNIAPKVDRFIRKLAFWQFKVEGQKPRLGRFYPNKVLAGVTIPIGPPDKPFRVIKVEEDGFTCDFNAPLAGQTVSVGARVVEPYISAREISPDSVDWLHRLTVGPGMQARADGQPTDFGLAGAMERENENPDLQFYAEPRLVGHVDSLASRHIGETYASLAPKGGKVLDLMASLQSHLPAGLAGQVAGLGLNAEEMAANPVLTSHQVHDLNADPVIPQPDNEFDAVLISLSVEYLTDPARVMAEARRVLKPGGVLAISFSNRFFPPKAVALWKQLHDFERMGWVLDLFLSAGGFAELNTLSRRNWPRPTDDRHYPEYRLSDPVYLVWGRKK